MNKNMKKVIKRKMNMKLGKSMEVKKDEKGAQQMNMDLNIKLIKHMNINEKKLENEEQGAQVMNMDMRKVIKK